MNKAKIFSLEELTDKYIGKRGTPKREAFEKKLQLDLSAHSGKAI